MSLPNKKYVKAHGALQTVVALVWVYGSGMVLAVETFATTLFDALGFGPNSKGLAEDGVQYSFFAFGVLGAVIMGWMTLMWFVLKLAIHKDPEVRFAARTALVASTAVWFTFDTGYSIAIGEINHALFNVPFVSCLGIPLYFMIQADKNSNKKGN